MFVLYTVQTLHYCILTRLTTFVDCVFIIPIPHTVEIEIFCVPRGRNDNNLIVRFPVVES